MHKKLLLACVTTAFFENMTVWDLFLGRASLAKTMPAMQEEMTTPTILWTLITRTASGQASVV